MKRAARTRASRRILVAALGCPLRGDDGFGPKLLARVARNMPPGVCTRDFGTHGVALVQALFDPLDVLILLDACRRGGRPGSVYMIRPDIPARGEAPPGVHLTAPDAVLAMAAALGVLPPDVWMVGCEPASVQDFRRTLSRPVRCSMGLATRMVHDLVTTVLRSDGARSRFAEDVHA